MNLSCGPRRATRPEPPFAILLKEADAEELILEIVQTN